MGSRIIISGARAHVILSHRTPVAIGFLLVSLFSLAGAADPDSRPGDRLLRLVPPDVAVTVSIEDLRGHASAFLKSRLAEEFWQLPAVRGWFSSEKYQQFERARSQIETLLGASVTDVRDELLGDAVILALRLPPEAGADASLARGIMLVQARDPELLERMIRLINTAQKESGELAGVGDRQRNDMTYHVREFPPAAKRPAEWYVAYPDGTFAFSNSEVMIQSVVDRKSAERGNEDGVKRSPKIDPGLAELSRLKGVRGKLPERALARVYVDPRQVERLLANVPRPNERNDPRVIAMLERYLAAVDYAGAALTWNDDSIVFQMVETLNPSLLDPWLRRWAADAARRRSHTRTRAADGTGSCIRPCPWSGPARRRFADRARKGPDQAGQPRDAVHWPFARSGPTNQDPASGWTGHDRLPGRAG